MIRRPPRSTQSRSSAASDVYKRQVCEPECPAEAIFADTEPGLDSWLKLNAQYAETWPNIAVKRDPPEDATAFDGAPNKFEEYFSPAPGQGDAPEEPKATPPTSPPSNP